MLRVIPARFPAARGCETRAVG